MKDGATLRVIALSCEFSGTLIIAILLLLLHQRMMHAESISNKNVVKFMKRERIMVIAAITIIAIGFVLLLIDAL